MPQHGQRSKDNLGECHRDLQLIFRTVIAHFDHSIICGRRDKAAQDAAYNSGASQVAWPDSKHNKQPSMATDAAPYPIDWDDLPRFNYFAGYVLATAQYLHDEGLISHRLRWGGDWDQDTEVADNEFNDLVHFELMP